MEDKLHEITEDITAEEVAAKNIALSDASKVLSGNHRVQASIQADLPWILIIVLLGDVSQNDQIKIQLSHNALVGEDEKLSPQKTGTVPI